MDTSYYDLNSFGVNTQAIHDFIREDLNKVLSGQRKSYSVSDLFRYDYYHYLISELIGEPLEIEDFNGWEQDFCHQFEFNGEKFVFYGSVWENSYTIQREE